MSVTISKTLVFPQLQSQLIILDLMTVPRDHDLTESHCNLAHGMSDAPMHVTTDAAHPGARQQRHFGRAGG